MVQTVVRAIRGNVAVLTLDAPPGNTLSAPVRADLMAALAGAATDPAVVAVVIAAAPPGYPSGAVLAEIDRAETPTLAALCSAAETLPKPVVAAVDGAALGAGLDLALACHYRIAHPGARLGFPEIGLGVVPSGGGTQRLPRLVGAGPALDMLLGGVPVTADAAQAMRLIDAIGPGGAAFLDYAVDFAAQLAATGARSRPTRSRRDGFADGRAYLAEVATRRAAVRGEPVLAATRAVDCVEAAMIMSFEQGLEAEQAALEDCAATTESRALRHAVLAERRAARHLASMAGRESPRSVGIAGHLDAAAPLALACLEAGLEVTLHAPGLPVLEATVARVDRLCDAAIARGTLSEAERDARLDRLSGAIDSTAMAGERLVLVPLSPAQDTAAGSAVLARVLAATAPSATVGIVSAWHDVGSLVAGLPDPARVVAVLPAPAGLRLAEVGATPRSSAAAVADAARLARQLGRVTIGCTARPGLVLGRMLAALHHACDRLLEDGATPRRIDAALRRYGFPVGPYRMRDAEGTSPDLVRLRRQAQQARGITPPVIEDYLAELGWFGRAAGRGWYRYSDGPGDTEDDPDVLAVIADERRELGLTARIVSEAEIVTRCLDALANTGAALLRARDVRGPADIDLAMMHGALFPRWRGGPMFAADAGGIPALERRLLRLAEGRDPGFWGPDPLITDLRKNGRAFGDLGVA
jgi:3-hydroxyacyl-CoA dehydrogenase